MFCPTRSYLFFRIIMVRQSTVGQKTWCHVKTLKNTFWGAILFFISSFRLWGTAFLAEWLSTGHKRNIYLKRIILPEPCYFCFSLSTFYLNFGDLSNCSFPLLMFPWHSRFIFSPVQCAIYLFFVELK